jgi:hypothetical protein
MTLRKVQGRMRHPCRVHKSRLHPTPPHPSRQGSQSLREPHVPSTSHIVRLNPAALLLPRILSAPPIDPLRSFRTIAHIPKRLFYFLSTRRNLALSPRPIVPPVACQPRHLPTLERIVRYPEPRYKSSGNSAFIWNSTGE